MSKAEKSLSDKCAVITGGASGIGFEIADNFLRKGARKVILLDLNSKVGADAVKCLTAKYGDRATFIECDVTNETDMETTFKKLIDECKTIDVLVNNAGVLNDRKWKKCIDTNLTYLIGWSLKFWEHMRQDRSGHGGTIINLSSVYGFRVVQFLPVYQASKFGVLGFSKSLGHQYNYGRTGVRVVALCPSFTRTSIYAPGSPVTLEDDEDFTADVAKYLEEDVVWQTADCVGAATVDVFEKADSGTAWLIEGGKPISQVM